MNKSNFSFGKNNIKDKSMYYFLNFNCYMYSFMYHDSVSKQCVDNYDL